MSLHDPAITERLAKVESRIQKAAERSGRRALGYNASGGFEEVLRSLICAQPMRPDCANSERTIFRNSPRNGQSSTILLTRNIISSVICSRTKRVWLASFSTVVQTVDSAKFLARLDAAAGELGSHLEVMLEVKLSDEESKSGALPEEVPALLEAASRCSHLTVSGLMTMPPWSADPEHSRPYFRQLAALARELDSKNFHGNVRRSGSGYRRGRDNSTGWNRTVWASREAGPLNNVRRFQMARCRGTARRCARRRRLSKKTARHRAVKNSSAWWFPCATACAWPPTCFCLAAGPERGPLADCADPHAIQPQISGEPKLPLFRQAGIRASSIEDVRGRFASQGKFGNIVQEGADGNDTINWISEQPWSNGRVGMAGGSYLGMVQWWAALEENSHLAAISPVCSGDDEYTDRYYSTGGALKLGHRLLWLSENLTPPSGVPALLPSYIRHLPVKSADIAATGLPQPLWRSALAHPSFDEYWKRFSVRERIQARERPHAFLRRLVR